MKKIIISICFVSIICSLHAQEIKSVMLPAPDLTRGFPVMKALSLRASAKDFDTISLKLEDISDMLWAANGINRPDLNKRTAPSAMNAQDIDIYVFMKSGVSIYNAPKHCLDHIISGDYRGMVAGRQENFAKAPLFLLLVSDISRFKNGTDSLKAIWAAEDAGIVSQNISVFCASVGLGTRPRATMDQQKLREILKLKDSQKLILNNPVGFKKD